METCINYSQFRQVLVCNLSLCATYIPERSKPLCMYVRAGRRPPGESAAELTHPCTLHIRTHALSYHPHLCNLLVLSNLPFFLPQQNRKRKKKRESRVLNYICMYLPCHPAIKHGDVIHFGLLMVPCDYHVTKIFAAKKMPIESLLHSQLLITITQSYL